MEQRDAKGQKPTRWIHFGATDLRVDPEEPRDAFLSSRSRTMQMHKNGCAMQAEYAQALTEGRIAPFSCCTSFSCTFFSRSFFSCRVSSCRVFACPEDSLHPAQ